MPPACDASRIHPGETDLADFRALIAHPGDLLVLFAGRLEHDNGPGALLQALPQVLDETPGVRAVLAGEGDGAPSLMQAAQEMRVADHCTFIGHVPDRVMGCLYACCDVLAAPATYAPSGMAAIEAMTLGTPVIGSDLGALCDLIADGVNGMRISPGDPDALAGCLIRLAEERDMIREMGRTARRTIGELRSWEQSARRFVDAAERLAGERALPEPTAET